MSIAPCWGPFVPGASHGTHVHHPVPFLIPFGSPSENCPHATEGWKPQPPSRPHRHPSPCQGWMAPAVRLRDVPIGVAQRACPQPRASGMLCLSLQGMAGHCGQPGDGERGVPVCPSVCLCGSRGEVGGARARKPRGQHLYPRGRGVSALFIGGEGLCPLPVAPGCWRRGDTRGCPPGSTGQRETAFRLCLFFDWLFVCFYQLCCFLYESVLGLNS